MYENTYLEKEKLWKLYGLKGAMREKSDKEFMRKAFELSLRSSAIFCINTVVDWLYLADAFDGDPYQYRINTPGTTVSRNWSLLLPLSLEEMCKLKTNTAIRAMVSGSGRV
jgi:4-alpha-glucanotransferase